MQTVAFDAKDLNVPGHHDYQGLLSSLWPEVFKNGQESCGISLVSRFKVQKVSSKECYSSRRHMDTWQRAGVSRAAKDGRAGPWLGLD